MKLFISFEVSAKELEKYATTQESINGLVGTIYEAMGIEFKPAFNISKMDKIKILMGSGITRAMEKDGLEASITYNKEGIKGHVIFTQDPDTVTNIFDAYIDVVTIYTPVVTGAIASFAAANKEANDRLRKAIK